MWWLDAPLWTTNANLITLITVSILGIGSFVSTLEWLTNRKQLRSDGLLSFDVLGSRPLLIGQRISARAFRRVLGYRSYCSMLIVRLSALAMLPLSIALHRQMPTVLLLGVILITGSLIHVRSPFGLDGSDQMTTQVYGALFIGTALGGGVFLEIALWYIAAQSALAYFASGTAKLVSPIWRKGGVTQRVFNTRTYGHEAAARLIMAHTQIGRSLDWVAIGAETLFPLCLVAGFPLVFAFLAWGIVFHFANAAIMGLNSFFWAFVSTYPAILFTASMIQTHMSGL